MAKNRVQMMVKEAFKIPTSSIALGGGALTAALLAGDIVDDIGDVLKQKYIAQAKPTWETAGQAELMNDYGNLYRSTRAKEMLYNMMFDSPEQLTGSAGKEMGRTLVDGMTRPPAASAEQIIGSMANLPEVQSLGKQRAQDFIKEVIAVAPTVTAAAPSVTLPILQTAIDSGSMALRPEMLKTLVDAESKYLHK